MIITTLHKIGYTLSKKIAKDVPLYCILLLSLSVNLVYVFWGADLLLGDEKYIAGDTSGWTDSFLNLLKYGTYTFDTQNEMASFGRVPGFSFFWGIHYLLFGANYVYQAVAFTQAILSTACTYLIFSIASKIYTVRSVALLSAFLYATYPFTLYWITISYAEPLSNFINLLCINTLLISNKSTRAYIAIGLLSALAFYTREFMGFILAVSLIYILFDRTLVARRERLWACLAVLISFLSLYSLWPLRNYIYHDKLLLGRDYNGFKLYNEHLLSYTDWVHCWDNNDDKWIKAAVFDGDAINFPSDIFQNREEEQKAKSLIKEANQCATSFIYWEQVLTGIDSDLPAHRCDEKIKKGFDELRESFIKNHPWRYVFEVPLKNLHKVFFKSQLQEGSLIKNDRGDLLYYLIFRYRTAILILAIAGLLISYKNHQTLPIIISYSFILFFMCFLYRYIEMRNFMQTDVLLIIPCSYCFISIFKNKLRDP